MYVEKVFKRTCKQDLVKILSIYKMRAFQGRASCEREQVQRAKHAISFYNATQWAKGTIKYN